MITIDKFYGETVELNGIWRKIGLTIKSDKKLKDAKETAKHSKDLLTLGRKLINAEIESLKQK